MSRIFEEMDVVLDPNELNSLSSPVDGRADPTGSFPKQEYVDGSGVNDKARGTKRTNVYTGGGGMDLDLELKPEAVATYPNSQVKETASGHIIETDDTPGAERVMVRHNSGSGVEMRADGTVIYSATNNTIRVTANDEKVVVDGDGELQYNGNLRLKVAGDFDLEVGGDFNVTVEGDEEKKVKRGVNTQIAGSIETEIVGSKSETVVGSASNMVLGDKTEIIKGSNSLFVGQDEAHNVGGTLLMTAEKEVTISTKSANIAASSLAVSGDSGTIGGANIVYYGHTAHIPRVNVTSLHASQGVIATVGMTAPVFNGDLSGNASTAGKAATAAIGPAAGSTTAPVTITPAADSNTVRPDNILLTDYLENSPLSIRRVDIDDEDDMKNSVDLTAKFGGVIKTQPSTRQARSKLRDPNNINTQTFIGALLADGIISSSFASLVPSVTGRTVPNEKIGIRGTEPIGRATNPNKLFTT